MSTYIYLECESHDPPLRANGESGQHLYDLPQLRDDIVNREAIAAAIALDANFGHFRNNTAWFLAQHPRCSLRIVDEYGRQHSLTDEEPKS